MQFDAFIFRPEFFSAFNFLSNTNRKKAATAVAKFRRRLHDLIPLYKLDVPNKNIFKLIEPMGIRAAVDILQKVNFYSK